MGQLALRNADGGVVFEFVLVFPTVFAALLLMYGSSAAIEAAWVTGVAARDAAWCELRAPEQRDWEVLGRILAQDRKGIEALEIATERRDSEVLENRRAERRSTVRLSDILPQGMSSDARGPLAARVTGSWGTPQRRVTRFLSVLSGTLTAGEAGLVDARFREIVDSLIAGSRAARPTAPSGIDPYHAEDPQNGPVVLGRHMPGEEGDSIRYLPVGGM